MQNVLRVIVSLSVIIGAMVVASYLRTPEHKLWVVQINRKNKIDTLINIDMGAMGVKLPSMNQILRHE
jgi:superfamily II DNA or RNA helicase